MKITPNTLTLQQLFLVGNEQFTIPAYQRRYAWGFKQQRDLFDDIRLLQDGDSHLFGTVLFLTDTHTPGINTLELVDGQQRITTLTLLIKALGERFVAIGETENAQEVQKLLRCKGFDGKPRAKLVLGDLDHPDFERVMSNNDLDRVMNRHLADAYSNFTQWLESLAVDEVGHFYYKLMNSATVIRLDVAQSKDAYKLFETINNRGLKLRPTDIIKNFLLGHASLLGESTLKAVKDDWRALIVALDQIESDDFFRQYLQGVLHHKISSSKLIAEFKGCYMRSVKEAEGLTEYRTYSLEDQDSEASEDAEEENGVEETLTDELIAKPIKKMTLPEFISGLRKAAEIYGHLRRRTFASGSVNRHLRNLERIKSFPAYTLLLSLFQRKLPDSQLIEIMIVLETFMMRRHICERRTGELDMIFASLTDGPTDGLAEYIREGLRRHTPSNYEFEEKFARFDFASKVLDRARYALEMFEYHAIGHKEEFYLADPSQLHLEHIIPQTIGTKKSKSEMGDWATYLGENWKRKHSSYVNKVGNMTLVADELNISASNNPFMAKKQCYKKSNIRLTKDIAEKYSTFKFAAVEKRSQEFARLAVQIWSL